MMRRNLMLVLLTTLVAPVSRLSAAPLTTAFTYQGSLDKSGLAVTSSCNFQFKLFDSLSTGAQIGTTLTPSVTLLELGQFSVQLDFGAGLFDGTQRWLEVSVQCPGDVGFTTLTPRQPITATPYALYALTGPGGSSIVLPYFGPVTSTAQDAFKIQNNATTGAYFAIHGLSATTATNAGGVLGEATGTTGQVIGAYGKAISSPNGIGVIGDGNVNGGFFEAHNTTGDGPAVYGLAHTNANNAAGVKGVNNSATGYTVGTWGVASASATGTGVAGIGGATGGYFQSNTGVGVAGDYAGVYGLGTAKPGVKGVSTIGYGVEAWGYSGLLARATPGQSGDGIDALGDSNGAGVNASTSGTGPGVRGTSTSGSGIEGNSTTGNGVTGYTTSGHAVHGETSSAGSIAVFGTNTLGNGIWGQSNAVGMSGVVGVSYNASGVGGWFQNNAGGLALYANGQISVNGLAQVKTLQILGADLAESFPVNGESVEPGTVVMIDGGADGALRVCDEAYSHRVAGVVSGANGLDAAVVLKGKTFDDAGHAAVAMSGRVWVKCDATSAPIHPGDLLTTADRAGLAMKVRDRDRAYGATIGKAMTELEHGTGLVLVLVSLQ